MRKARRRAASYRIIIVLRPHRRCRLVRLDPAKERIAHDFAEVLKVQDYCESIFQGPSTFRGSNGLPMGQQRLLRRTQPTLESTASQTQPPGPTTGTTSIPEVNFALPGAALRQRERPWMRQLNAPKGIVIAVPGKA